MTEPTHPRPSAPAELGFESIVYEKAPPRATITLNRPEILNAFDFQMLREIARACEDASWDDAIRVVVVTGAGRAFCVGANLREWADHYVGNPTEYRQCQIDILDGSTVKRTLAVTAPAAAYTAAQQTADFGSPQPSVSCRIFQLSATYGRGTPRSATL